MHVLIGVVSAQSLPERREACLATWASATPGCALVFVTGGHACAAPLRHGCRLECPAPDDYPSLPQKTRALCAWALEHTDCDYLFKCDDDTYVHLPRLLAAVPQGDYVGHDLGGYASGGAGYWLSRRASRIIAERLDAPTGHEDQLLGRVLAEAGMPVAHDRRLHPWNSHRPAPENDLITTHHCWPALMQEIHAAFVPSANAGPDDDLRGRSP
jgi:hypothetical protein